MESYKFNLGDNIIVQVSELKEDYSPIPRKELIIFSDDDYEKLKDFNFRKYYKENLQRKIFKNPIIGDILISGSGMGETEHNNRYTQKWLILITKLPEMLTKSTECDLDVKQYKPRKANKQADFVGIDYIYSHILYGNLLLDITIVIYKDKFGKRYYSFNNSSFNDKINKKESSNHNPRKVGGIGTSNNSITDTQENFNSSKVLYKEKLSDNHNIKERKMEERKFCMKSRAELDEIRKQQASKKASMNEAKGTYYLYAGYYELFISGHKMKKPYMFQFKADNLDDLYEYMIENFGDGDGGIDDPVFFTKDVADDIVALGLFGYEDAVEERIIDESKINENEIKEAPITSDETGFINSVIFTKNRHGYPVANLINTDVDGVVGRIVFSPDLTQDRSDYSALTGGREELRKQWVKVDIITIRDEVKAMLQENPDLINESKINEISDETVYDSVAKAHSVAKDGKTIQRAVRIHNKGLNREFAKNGLPNPKTLENPLTGDETRAKEYARVNKEYSDKIVSRMKSESLTASKALAMSKAILDEISDETVDRVYNKRMKNLAKAQSKFNPKTGEGFGDLVDAEQKVDRNLTLTLARDDRKREELQRKRRQAQSESKINEISGETVNKVRSERQRKYLDAFKKEDKAFEKHANARAELRNSSGYKIGIPRLDHVMNAIETEKEWTRAKEEKDLAAKKLDRNRQLMNNRAKSESKINEEDVVWHEKTFDGTKEGIKLTPEQARQLENMMSKVYNIINVIESLDDNELGNLAGIQSQQGFDITGHDLIDFFKVELGLDIA